MTARILRWIADKIDTATAEVEVPLSVGPVRGARTAFPDEAARQMRNGAAARLVDEETLGYVIFRVEQDGADANICLDLQVHHEAWPSLLSVMARTVLVGDQVHSS